MMETRAVDSQLEALFRARPELRLALPYLKSQVDTSLLALAGIQQQWVDAVYTIDESTVASSKLRWWGDELLAAREGHTHHPLAAALFASERAKQLDPALWREAVEAGLALREYPPARDFAAQVDAAEGFHGALARLETALGFGPDADASRAARLAALGHLLSALLHVDSPGVDNDVLPMQRLARHALDRSGLSEDSPARQAAIRDQLKDLQSAFVDAMYFPGPIALPSVLSSLANRAQLRRALKSRQPLAALANPRGRLGPLMALRAWRAARHRADH